MKYILQVILFLIGCFSAAAFSNLGGGIYQSDGSASDTQAAINAASTGNTVLLPAGTSTWSSTVTVNKAIHIVGAGAGHIITVSRSSVAVGTGTKTFSTHSSGLAITNGMVLRIEAAPQFYGTYNGRGTNMTGSVTSYSGTTLTLNVTNSSGIGTFDSWNISTVVPSTVINHGTDANTLISIAESTAGYTELSGIEFDQLVNPATGNTYGITMNQSTGGYAILIHDCWFRMPSGNYNAINAFANRGVIWNCSFDAQPFGMTSGGVGCTWPSGTYSWTTPSYWGMNDINGTNNLYVETCDFHYIYNASSTDENGREVLRYSLMDNCGFGTHGADTSNYGQRYFELGYDEFLFNGTSGDTCNLNYFAFFRGGTAIIHDNVIPNIASSDYGDKPEIVLTVYNLTRSGGPNPLWGLGTTNGADYHAPRQVGFGYVTGTGTAHSTNNAVNGAKDSITYVGDSEPIYQWNNTGTGAYATPAIEDYATPTGNEDTSANYVRVGRDYINGVKPGFVEYTYPHPLTALASGGGGTTQTYALTVNNGSGSGTYAPGTVINIAANPNSNEIFSHWSGSISYVAKTNANSTTVTMPAANITVSAQYIPYAPALSTNVIGL